MQRAEGQGQVGTRAAESEEGGSISDHGRGGRWGRRGGRRRGRRGGTVPEQPPPLGLPLQVEIVLLLALLPGPLVVIFLLQVPHGRPAVLLKILLVFWSRTQEGLVRRKADGARGALGRDGCPGTRTPTLVPRGPVSQEHIPGPWAMRGSPCLHRAPAWLQSSLKTVPWEGLNGGSMCLGDRTGWDEERGREQVRHGGAEAAASGRAEGLS